MMRLYIVLLVFVAACRPYRSLVVPPRDPASPAGKEFYEKIFNRSREERETMVLAAITGGNIPAFLKKLVPVHVSFTNATGNTISATYFVTPDYLSIGTDRDFARIPMTPLTAQQIADQFHCFLPTRKMVNDIYRQAVVQLAPVPLYSFRDSALIFWHHHLIIEGQRQGRKGLIAGIKKDVVITEKLTRDGKPGKVAIYGWHQPNGNPIQPLFTGHAGWYVDYSHGIRLVYRKIKVGKQWLDYTEVLKDPVLRPLLCDETTCDCYQYPY